MNSISRTVSNTLNKQKVPSMTSQAEVTNIVNHHALSLGYKENKSQVCNDDKEFTVCVYRNRLTSGADIHTDLLSPCFRLYLGYLDYTWTGQLS